jgi:glutaredoxin
MRRNGMTTLLSRVLGRSPKRTNATFTVYTRDGCCCCHTALEVLARYQPRYGFAIEEIDVDSDPQLAAEHGTSIPVVVMDGKVRFRGVVNPALLERLLRATTA